MGFPAIDLTMATVLITGGARGIGRATAEAFLADGATVAIADLDGAAASGAAAEMGRGANGYVVDVASRESFAALVHDVLRDLGRIDVLVNNAGVMPLGGFLEEDDSVSRTTMDVNVHGLVHGMRLVLPHMISRGSGHIVNVASMAGKVPIPGLAVYNASKFAAVGLSAAVREEFEHTGVSVSAVLPSAVRTRLTSGVPTGHGMPTVDPEDVARAIVGTVRSRRAETPVPAWLGAWDLIDAVVPERVQRLGKRLVDSRRGLTGVDRTARDAYEQAIKEQAAGR